VKARKSPRAGIGGGRSQPEKRIAGRQDATAGTGDQKNKLCGGRGHTETGETGRSNPLCVGNTFIKAISREARRAPYERLERSAGGLEG